MHPDTLMQLARQRGCDLQIAAHRRRLVQHATAHPTRTWTALRISQRTIRRALARRRPVLPAATAERSPFDACPCAA